MPNLETPITMRSRHRIEDRQSTIQKTKTMTSIDPNKKTGIELSEIMLDQSIYKHPMMFKMIIASSV